MLEWLCCGGENGLPGAVPELVKWSIVELHSWVMVAIVEEGRGVWLGVLWSGGILNGDISNGDILIGE